MNQLTAALWYIDAHHDTLREHGLRIHKDLSHLHSFNDWQKKIKKPKLSTQGLDGHVQSLSRLLSQPWLAKTKYSHLRILVESLCDVMFKYKQYLMQQRSRIEDTRHLFQPTHSLAETVELRTLKATDGPMNERYIPLFRRLQAAHLYEEVFTRFCA